jgi:Nickel responsive protein SCO4226-like
LQSISQASCEGINEVGNSYQWIQSFVTEDKIYCIHIAESKEAVREHSKMVKLPVNTISEVKVIIDPLTSNPHT